MAMVAPPTHDLSSYPRSASAEPPHHQIRALPPLPQPTARREGSFGSTGTPFSQNAAMMNGAQYATHARYGSNTAATRGGSSTGAMTTPTRSPSAPPFLDAPSRATIGKPLLASSATTSTTNSSSTSSPAQQPSPASSSRPSPTPSPASTPSSSAPPSLHHHHQHHHSNSASSLPRLPPVHLASGPSSAPPSGGSYPQAAAQQHAATNIAFSGGASSQYPAFPTGSFSGGHSQQQQQPPFPQQFPFIPSPHPHAYPGMSGLGGQYAPGPGPYSPGFGIGAAGGPLGGSPGAGGSGGGYDGGDQQRLLQQAQYQQQQWQMEMMRQAGGAATGTGYEWQQGPDGLIRRRATSGPAPPSHSPKFYTTPLPYPPSPAPSFSHQSYPTLPPGAMLAQFGGHGYPTPPGSIEGRSDSSSGREGYHPYRRNKTDSPDRSATAPAPPGTAAAPSSSSKTKPGRVPPPSLHTPTSSLSSSTHSRSDSAASLSLQNFPPLPKSSAPAAPPPNGYASAQHSAKNSGSSTSSSPAPASARSTPPSSPQVVPPRRKTGSQTSSGSSATGSFQVATGVAERERKPSVASTRSDGSSSVRSTTPTAASFANGKKPSPLSQQVASPQPAVNSPDRPGTPGTVRGSRGSMVRDDADDSDDTAEASTIGRASAVPPVMAKEKEKSGMKSKFKKAFSLSSSSSSTPALSEDELNGQGPKGGDQHIRRLSISSSESSPPRTPPSGHVSHPSVASASSTQSASRPPPTGGRRFGGMLNPKLNSSTDNISISSTVSSASVMIRKLGQMGKLARRNSLMGLTKAFKSKDKEGAEGDEKTGGGKKDKKKGALASTSVSHATVEVEAAHSANGISPAAALAKKHQQLYAEQEAAAAAAAANDPLVPPRSFHVHARTDSSASDASSVRSGWGRSKTTDDVTDRSTAKNKMLEKERERLKSHKGRKWGLGFGGKGEADDQSIADTASLSGSIREDPIQQQQPQHRPEPLHVQPNGQAYPSYGASNIDDDAIEYALPPMSFGDDDYEPSLSSTPPPIIRRDPKTVKGILKGAGTYNQENYAPRPQSRPRANSFDAPHQHARPGSPGNAALVGKIPSEAQVDGLAPSTTSNRTDTHPPTPSPSSDAPGSSPYANPGLNASAPALNSFISQPLRAAAAPGRTRANIAFAANLSVHTTWPASVYDRRPEPSTSNRLTPSLAQQIKEELNFFKMEEMDVHHQSRHLTHFFV